MEKSKSLFTEREGYTKEASSLDSEVWAALRPILEKYEAEGFKVREIQSVMDAAVSCLCIQTIGMKRRKDREESEKISGS